MTFINMRGRRQPTGRASDIEDLLKEAQNIANKAEELRHEQNKNPANMVGENKKAAELRQAINDAPNNLQKAAEERAKKKAET